MNSGFRCNVLGGLAVRKAQWLLKAQGSGRMTLEKELMAEVNNTLRKKMAETVLGLSEESK